MLKQKFAVTAEELGITFQTGTVAKQANGAVTIQKGDSVVFVSATAATSLRAGQDFFPLTVDYREKFTSAGRFPGGYFKREGKPSEKEILTSRLCDRPLRPLFPKGFLNEVQVIGLTLSVDLTNEPDILMVNGASAALMCSDIPWHGPIGCIRLAEIDGEFVVNPTHEQMFESRLDLIYVGNEQDMMMIEGSADELPVERFNEALEFAQQAIQPLIKAQKELAAQVAKQKKEFELYVADEKYLADIRNLVGDRLATGVFQDKKQDREAAVDALKEEATEKLTEQYGEDNFDENQVAMCFEVLQEELYRGHILSSGKRVDGRGPDDLRPLDAQTTMVPRVHGSSMFTRGETQAMVFATLGTTGDAQDLDGLTGGVKTKSFILHYNFPPYSVGETGRFGFTGRREVGHGALAERSLLPILPSEEDFPYAIRLVSEIMESNGSTSMASICGGSLALHDAGVPVSGHVAGISIGLVTEMDENEKITRHVLLTDILGAEDHFGDMDFKIAGTRHGVTGFQLDLKIKGLPLELARQAVQRNTETRMQILDVMEAAIQTPRPEVNEFAPRVHMLQIDPDKIGLLIGPGGKTIRRITEVSGAQIDINEDNSGRVSIYATSGPSMNRAIEEIDLLTAEIEIDKIYRGIVRGIKEFGCFVECLPGKEGLVHISELADFRVKKVEDVCKMGDELWVKCIGIDDKGRVKLSRRAAMQEREEAAKKAAGGATSADSTEEEPAEVK